VRELARPALDRWKSRLREHGSSRAVEFVSILLRANTDFLAYALLQGGPLRSYATRATPAGVESALQSALIYSVNLFAREEFRRDDSELLVLLGTVLGCGTREVMLRRDNLRKAPRSEEWMLYSWLVVGLGAEPPAYDPAIEQTFGYNYVSYLGQFRDSLERALARPE